LAPERFCVDDHASRNVVPRVGERLMRRAEIREKISGAHRQIAHAGAGILVV